jgi:hypothetical protein
MIKFCTLADGNPPKISLVYFRRRMASGAVLAVDQALGTAVSKADEFRRYAEEALRWAEQSKTEKEQIALIELARTWTQAAVQIESSLPGNTPIESSFPGNTQEDGSGRLKPRQS